MQYDMGMSVRVWDSTAVCLELGCVWLQLKDSDIHVVNSIREM